MTKQITVIKRDGSRVTLDTTKFLSIAKATGLTDEKANAVTKTLTERVTQNAQANNNTISVEDIRKLFIEELTKMDKYAANLYAWYEKTK